MVLACSAAARTAGVRVGLRRREAQARCPELAVLSDDPARDARAFEPVLDAVEAVVPGVEAIQPGECAAAVRGAARYFGGDGAVVAAVAAAVAPVTGGAGRVGVADGLFTAGLAARMGTIVVPGGSREFLAPLSVDVLGHLDLADLLRRLGLPTLGAFAALPADDVLARFGPAGVVAHRFAQGRDSRRVTPREKSVDYSVTIAFDPPVDRVELVAFAARGLAERLHGRLAATGLACTRILIEARTEHGSTMSRTWRHDGPLTSAAIAERIRWQLAGWLAADDGAPGEGAPGEGAGDGGERAPDGVDSVVSLRVVPDDLVRADGRQLGLWGEPGSGAQRVARALNRVQGILGPDAVVTAVLVGGRGPLERVHIVPWGEPRPDPGETGPPWPGRLPAPSPSTVFSQPSPAAVVDADGAGVGVSGRSELTGVPAWLSVDGGPPVRISAWAGPWPTDENWWAPPGEPGGRERSAARRRRARFQVAGADGAVWLLAVENGRWWVEAGYD
jgi:protein ImuB